MYTLHFLCSCLWMTSHFVCGGGRPEWEKPWVSVSSGEGHDWVKDPKTSGLWESDLPVNAGSTCRKRLPYLSSPGYLWPEDYAVTESAFIEISSTCVLGPAVYHKPCLPVYLYILTTSPCLAYAITHLPVQLYIINTWSFWMAVGSQPPETSTSVLSISLHLLFGPTQDQVPDAIQDHGTVWNSHLDFSTAMVCNLEL